MEADRSGRIGGIGCRKFASGRFRCPRRGEGIRESGRITNERTNGQTNERTNESRMASARATSPQRDNRVASVNEKGIKRTGRVCHGGRGFGGWGLGARASRETGESTQGVLKRVLSIIEIASGVAVARGSGVNLSARPLPFARSRKVYIVCARCTMHRCTVHQG